VEARDADTALYWVLTYLTEPILDWLFTHESDPIAALADAIGSLPPAPDWEEILGHLE
jgi:hypothetical protein